ncbi:hypothetical protein [Brevibacterium sp.]|uniref:hypothetical protein n=1 Tax=Brevibacterium sp. TaxID=1701 RepID=UPI002811E002|nr:hypothetical protein [Brevibacterium sp.]
MSNGNDEPKVPRPSSKGPEDSTSESAAKSADATSQDSVETSKPDSTPSAPNDSRPNDSGSSPEPASETSANDSATGPTAEHDSRSASKPEPEPRSKPEPESGSKPEPESEAPPAADDGSTDIEAEDSSPASVGADSRASSADDQSDTVSMSLADRQDAAGPSPEEMRLSDRQAEPDTPSQGDEPAASTEALPQAPTYSAPDAPAYPPTAPSPQTSSYPGDQAPPLTPPYPDSGPAQGGPREPQGPPPGAPHYGEAQQQNGPQYGGPGPQQTGSPSAPYGAPQHGGPQGPQHGGPQGPQTAQYGAVPGPQYGGPQQSPVPQQSGSGPGHSQSIPQPAPAPGFAGGATATRADSRPRTKKKGRLPLFIALGSVLLVLVLVAVGFLVINSVNKNNYGPDKVAEEYVAALSKGDFAAAEKIAPSPRPEGTNLDLLSKNFTEGSSAKVENAKVESSSVEGDSGKVVVSYELGGTAYNVELPAKKDGKQDLFFDKWTLTGPALHVISLDIPAADGMTVNGTEYQAQAGTTSFAVYPGNYDFKIPASKWVGEASDTAEVNFPQAFAPGEKPNTEQVAPLTLNLSLSPTPDFEKEVQKQVEAELKKCFDNKDIKPKCKFINFDPTQIPVGGTDDKLDDLAKKDTAEWKIKEMPQVKASFGVGDTSTGSFFTDKQGSFDFSVDGKQRGSSYFSNGNPLSVSGSVKIDGDKLSIEFFDF